MGLKQSKKKQDMVEPMCENAKIETSRVVKIGDENNLALLRFCINNKSNEIITALESGTDLASPFNGAPLIISASLALLNDSDFERFRSNWETLLKFFNSDIPIMDVTDLRLTNFTQDSTDRRSTCYPILHVGSISRSVIDTNYTNYSSGNMGKLKQYNLKNTLLFIMTNIQMALETITKSKNSNVFVDYRGSKTERMETIIKKNCKYIIDNINQIEKYWNQQIQYKDYYDKYNNDYTMDIPYATVAEQNVESGK